MTETSTNNNHLEKKLIIVDQAEGQITIKDKSLLKELIYDLESHSHKYFIIEWN